MNIINYKNNFRIALVTLAVLISRNLSYAQLPAAPALATTNVTEASQYGVLYELNIPNVANYTSAASIIYAINNSSLTGLNYTRVAYFMQLNTKWVWVSMNKFNTTNAQLGIPHQNSTINWQQTISGMNVYSSAGSGVTSTLNATGNIEIWPHCYGQGIGLAGIGGNANSYDFNDSQNPGSNCYGSFQIHNYGAAQSVLCFNSFNNGNNVDLGIGNQVGGSGHPDWTFSYNSASFTTKKLYILVNAGLSFNSQPSTAAQNICQNSATSSLSVSLNTTTLTISNYKWYSNTTNSNTGGTLVTTATSSLTTNSFTPSSSTPGTLYYYCIVSATNGYSATSNPSGAITINNTPNINISATNSVLCSGSTLTLSALGSLNSYTWSTGANTSSIITTPGITTSYSLTGTTSNGCVGSSSVLTITVNSTPTISANNGTICTGNNFTISPSGASSYTYSSGSSIVSPSVNSTYTITGSNGNCISSKTISLVINPNPTVSVTNGTICSGQTYTIQPTGAISYSYSNGSSTIAPSLTATYSVTGSNVFSCTNTKTLTITVNQNPTITVNSAAICVGQSFTMTPNGASTYTYSSGSNIVSPSVNTNYTVTGTNSNGCVSLTGAVSSLTVNALPVISVNSGAICAGDSFTLIPSGASTYTYSSGSTVVSPSVNANYTVTGTDNNGCIAAVGAVSSLTVNALPVISVNSGAICAGDSFTLIPSGASTYTYSSGSNIVSPSVNTNYTITGTGNNGCVGSTGVVSSLTVNALPVIIVNSGAICSGQSFTITPSGASTYTYSSGSNIVSPIANSNYIVTGTDNNGCVSSTGAVSSGYFC